MVYKHVVEDHGLSAFDPWTWTSYQATKSRTQIPSYNMSVICDPNETPMASP